MEEEKKEEEEEEENAQNNENNPPCRFQHIVSVAEHAIAGVCKQNGQTIQRHTPELQ